MNIEYIECECQSEVCQIIYDDEEKEFYLSFFEYGLYNCRWTLFDKIKYFFRVLKHGKMSQDGIMMNIKEAKKLKDFLDKNIFIRGKKKGFLNEALDDSAGKCTEPACKPLNEMNVFDSGYTGYCADEKYRSKTHIFVDGKALCGYKPKYNMKCHKCSSQINLSFVECKKCRDIFL